MTTSPSRIGTGPRMGDTSRGRIQEATVGAWLKSARQSGSSDGLRVSVI